LDSTTVKSSTECLVQVVGYFVVSKCRLSLSGVCARLEEPFPGDTEFQVKHDWYVSKTRWILEHHCVWCGQNEYIRV